MIIGVLSDTHGNRRLMHRVADLMAARFDVGLFFHLGDNYDDAEELAAYGHEVRRVPGLWCREYHDPKTPNRVDETIEGATCCAMHAEKDLRAVDRGADIVLLGHTHEARIEAIGPSLWVNPGHLKAKPDRGRPPSFATVTIEPGRLRAAIHETDGRVRMEQTVPRKTPSETKSS